MPDGKPPENRRALFLPEGVLGTAREGGAQVAEPRLLLGLGGLGMAGLGQRRCGGHDFGPFALGGVDATDLGNRAPARLRTAWRACGDFVAL